MKQYEVTIKYIAYRQVLVWGKDQDMAYDEAMYIAKIANWNDPNQYEISIQSIKQVKSGD